MLDIIPSESSSCEELNEYIIKRIKIILNDKETYSIDLTATDISFLIFEINNIVKNTNYISLLTEDNKKHFYSMYTRLLTVLDYAMNFIVKGDNSFITVIKQRNKKSESISTEEYMKNTIFDIIKDALFDIEYCLQG